MTKEKTALPTLEASFTEVEQLINSMEQGELNLEKSLTQFERGMTLIKHCQKILAETEQKVKILMQSDASETLTPYEVTNGTPNHE